jgi:pilus assembly protein TadC
MARIYRGATDGGAWWPQWLPRGRGWKLALLAALMLAASFLGGMVGPMIAARNRERKIDEAIQKADEAYQRFDDEMSHMLPP